MGRACHIRHWRSCISHGSGSGRVGARNRRWASDRTVSGRDRPDGYIGRTVTVRMAPGGKLGRYGVLADLRGAQHAIEQQVEIVGHLLGALSGPDVQRLRGTLCLLQ